MIARSKLLVTAAAAALLLVVAYFLEFGLPSPGTDRPSKPQSSQAKESAASAPATLDAVGREAIPPRETASDQAASSHPSEPASTELSRSGPGRLVISAIDAETRKPVGRFYVRALDGTKINELHSSLGKTTLSISLLPAMYELLVGAQGYEPSALPATRVPPGETVTLDPVPLRAGDASILGMVFGGGSIEPGLQMELLGAGRRPCEKCPLGANPSYPGRPDEDLAWVRIVPCPTCGYAGKSSVLPVPESSTVSFRSLASGAYTLRLISKQAQPIGNPTTVELRAGETLPVELDYAPLRTLHVEILDTDGQSLATDWAARIRARRAGDVSLANDPSPAPEASNPREFDCWFDSGNTWIASSSFLPPEPAGHMGKYPNSGGGRNSAASRRWDLRLNRSRSLNRMLRPEERAPELEPYTLPARIDAAGLVCFESVPSMALTLQVDCRLFTVTITIPSSSDTTPLRAQLTSTTKSPSQTGSDAQQGSKTFREFEALLNR